MRASCNKLPDAALLSVSYSGEFIKVIGLSGKGRVWLHWVSPVGRNHGGEMWRCANNELLPYWQLLKGRKRPLDVLIQENLRKVKGR